ncbi:hypothetical protein AYO20_04606 [Fonsecaea nubica]|uniref:Aminoglycoside phosphotransferase domain-containing protein n=1 Tax=Fonsecaea nubica TaxID=856822 RepID=A0A178D3S7_9EURO|nr:hypothetical protein AYO20_04606 [Fonsecaea nubica]OAL36192.1 hypothetical protein AYO20_04606 [Fonsecaea nubica]
MKNLTIVDLQCDGPDIVFLSTSRRTVLRRGNVVIKSGSSVRREEADTLRFVRQNTSVPVPEVYDDYPQSDGTHVIVMEYVEGEPLSELWPTLSNEEKLEISGQLREILGNLREKRGNYIGGIGGTAAVDSRKTTLVGGPFATEMQFNDFLQSDLIKAAQRRFSSTFSKVMTSTHKILLTHGDINPRNIIIHNRRITAVLDWENAGWYPEYWEYVKFFSALDDSDWETYTKHIFPQTYPQELVNDLLLGQLLRH